MNIMIKNVAPSAYVHHCDAIDVYITVDGIEGDATLVRDRHDESAWAPYGNSPDMWVSWELLSQIDDVDALYSAIMVALDLEEVESFFC